MYTVQVSGVINVGNEAELQNTKQNNEVWWFDSLSEPATSVTVSFM